MRNAISRHDDGEGGYMIFQRFFGEFKGKNATFVWYCVPLILCLLVLTVAPFVLTFTLSLTPLNLMRPGSFHFVGLANYLKAIADPAFLNAIKITGLFIVVPIPIQIILGIGLALLLSHKSRIIQASRSLYIMPMVISPVVVGIIWRMMLLPSMGGFDHALSIFGMRAPDLLGSPLGAQFAVILTTVWEWTPFVMLMVLAALQSMPKEPFESARIDGANWMQIFRHVTLPLLKPVLMVVILLRVIGSLSVFPVVYSMTGGGPGRSTEPINLFAFRQGFDYLKVGYAATIIIYIFVLFLVIEGYFLRASLRAMK